MPNPFPQSGHVALSFDDRLAFRRLDEREIIKGTVFIPCDGPPPPEGPRTAVEPHERPDPVKGNSEPRCRGARAGPSRARRGFAVASGHRPRLAPKDIAASPRPGGRCRRAATPVGQDSWAELLKRVYEVDPLACTKCGGRLSWIALITQPVAVRRILEHLKLPADLPRLAPARDPP